MTDVLETSKQQSYRRIGARKEMSKHDTAQWTVRSDYMQSDRNKSVPQVNKFTAATHHSGVELESC